MRVEISPIRQFLRRITRTRYARALETDLARVLKENSRLRNENRGLLNSILGIAGIPPVYPDSAEEPRSFLSARAGPEAPASGPVSPSREHRSEADASQTAPPIEHRKSPGQVTPLRRRSWHQINRALEFNAARKTPQARMED
jgi:hypothetical protein